MDGWKDLAALVIDNGSDACKAGFAGEDAPRAVIPSVVGRTTDSLDSYVGAAAQAKRSILALEHPLAHGTITDWAALEQIWHHLFHAALRVAPGAHAVLHTAAPSAPRAARARIAQTAFETHAAPACAVALAPPLALYACAGRTALVLDAGAGAAHAVPVYAGAAVRHGVQRAGVGGRALTQALVERLAGRGHAGALEMGSEIVREVKERMCYVALDADREGESAARAGEAERRYELPDGRVVDLGDERFLVPEALFRPELLGLERPGIHETIYNAISKCDPDLHRDLYGRIVLTGGTTMLPGLADRLQKELAALAPAGVKVKVVAPPERRYGVWIGASILASLSTFENIWVTRAEYEEFGERIVCWKGL